MDYLDEEHQEYDISLRVVRFEIAPGSFENIITNLPDINFDFEDFKDLYHMRWNEENSFRDLNFRRGHPGFFSKRLSVCLLYPFFVMLFIYCLQITLLAYIQSLVEPDNC